MPTPLFQADSGFPQLNGNQTTAEKFRVLTDYLYQLLELLRYTLNNLEPDNFNEEALNVYVGDVTNPIYNNLERLNGSTESLTGRMEDAEGNVSELYRTADSLTSRITNAEGDVSVLQQTAGSLTSRITNAEGDVSTLQQTADSLTSRITNAEGDVSTLQQTAGSLTSRITNAEGDVSTLQQTAGSLASRITNAEGDVSTLQQTAGSLASRITSAEGNISTVTQTADSVASEVKDARGNKSTLKQSIAGFQLSVSEAANGAMTYTFKNDGLSINNTITQKKQYLVDGKWYDAWDSSWANKAVYTRSSYDGGKTYGPTYMIQGVEGVSVLLNNNPYVFAGSESAALAGQASVGVLAFRGGSQVAATIGTITGMPAGMAVSVLSNGTTAARFTATVTTALAARQGALTVPVTVSLNGANQTYTLYWSWSVALKGAKGDKGDQGTPGSNANVTFTTVNSALGTLFKTWAGGTPTTVTDSYIYSPKIKGGEVYSAKIYAGQGSGFAQMDAEGLTVYDPNGSAKIGMGYYTGSQGWTYPYISLGVGTGSASSGSGILQKLGAGLWIGDGKWTTGGQYPGGASSLADNVGNNVTGLFIDFNNDKIYKFLKGKYTVVGATTTAVWG